MAELSFNKNEITQLIERLLNPMIGKGPAVSVPIAEKMNIWEWESGVAVFAIYLYYRETGRKDLLDFLVSWFDKRIAEVLPPKNVNSMCPFLTLSYVYELTKDGRYLELCREWVEFAMNGMPRTEEDGIQHMVVNSYNEGQIWDDTLYMTVLFLCRMGILLQNEVYIQESIRQYLVHLKYLTDPKTGLLFHGWGFKEKSHFAGALWGRGNGWFGAALADYLEMIELPAGVKMFLLSSFERQVKALAGLQSPEGLWHTLLDDPSSYLETSASAAFCYSILKGVRKGYIGEEYRETAMKGVKGVIGMIDSEGVVQGVSFGTAIGMKLQHYREIPQRPQPYGQTLTLLMLVELLKHKPSA